MSAAHVVIVHTRRNIHGSPVAVANCRACWFGTVWMSLAEATQHATSHATKHGTEVVQVSA